MLFQTRLAVRVCLCENEFRAGVHPIILYLQKQRSDNKHKLTLGLCSLLITEFQITVEATKATY